MRMRPKNFVLLAAGLLLCSFAVLALLSQFAATTKAQAPDYWNLSDDASEWDDVMWDSDHHDYHLEVAV